MYERNWFQLQNTNRAICSVYSLLELAGQRVCFTGVSGQQAKYHLLLRVGGPRMGGGEEINMEL